MAKVVVAVVCFLWKLRTGWVEGNWKGSKWSRQELGYRRWVLRGVGVVRVGREVEVGGWRIWNHVGPGLS